MQKYTEESKKEYEDFYRDWLPTVGIIKSWRDSDKTDDKIPNGSAKELIQECMRLYWFIDDAKLDHSSTREDELGLDNSEIILYIAAIQEKLGNVMSWPVK